MNMTSQLSAIAFRMSLFFYFILLLASCNSHENKQSILKEGKLGPISFRIFSKNYAMKVDQNQQIDTSNGCYLKLDLTITNNNDKPINFDSSNFKLTDDRENIFPFSKNCELIFSMESESLNSVIINPKSSKTGFLAFEVPLRTNYKLHLKNILPFKDSIVIDLKD